ncbi:hypothetical protein ACR8UD_004775 [Escherichia coli]
MGAASAAALDLHGGITTALWQRSCRHTDGLPLAKPASRDAVKRGGAMRWYAEKETPRSEAYRAF